jgi:hypothetical protein
VVEVSINDNILKLKEYILKKTGKINNLSPDRSAQGFKIPVINQTLIYKGEELKNEFVIGETALPFESTLYLIDCRKTTE